VADRAAAPGRDGMTARKTVVGILDHARRTGDYDALERLLYLFFPRPDPDKAEIIQEAMLEVARKMASGETSIALAPQLRGFLKTCTLRIRGEATTAANRLGDTGDEVDDVPAPRSSDPAVLLVRLEEMDEKIALLTKLGQSNPRYLEALAADAQEIPIPQHFKVKLDEDITPDNARKLRERAKEKVVKGLRSDLKDSSS
jgi:hypothetical protein